MRAMVLIWLFSASLLGCGDLDAPPVDVCATGPQCAQNTLLSCGPEQTEVQAPCGAARCAADAPVPQCVPADALPCTPELTATRCLAGRQVVCSETSGYLAEAPCEAGEICVGEAPAQCQPFERVRCVPATWSPLCLGGVLVECDGDTRLLSPGPGC